jgi:bifunctional non-homologous end joining protein LigD
MPISPSCTEHLSRPCIPTRGTRVPGSPEWLHEIKHDGYRMILQREGKRVRLWTRNGHDWSRRYPRNRGSRAAPPARHLRRARKAVLLGVDGIADFNALHSRKMTATCSSTRSIC